MALSMRTRVPVKTCKTRAKVASRTAMRPVAALTRSQVAGAATLGTASLAALAAFSASPAEAHNMVSVLASAKEGWPFVPPIWMPSVLVPVTGLVLPAIGFATFFIYLEKDAAKQE